MISIGLSSCADITPAQIAEAAAGPSNTPVSIRFQRQGPPFVDKTVLAIRGAVLQDAGHAVDGRTSLQGPPNENEGHAPTPALPPAALASPGNVPAPQDSVGRAQDATVLSQLIGDLKDILDKNASAIGSIVRSDTGGGQGSSLSMHPTQQQWPSSCPPPVPSRRRRGPAARTQPRGGSGGGDGAAGSPSVRRHESMPSSPAHYITTGGENTTESTTDGGIRGAKDLILSLMQVRLLLLSGSM